MVYFYGSKEQAKGIDVDAFASDAFKEPLSDATLVYTDDKELTANCKKAKVEVKPITSDKDK